MMSWERKWKQFQTADRIDEAPDRRPISLTEESKADAEGAAKIAAEKVAAEEAAAEKAASEKAAAEKKRTTRTTYTGKDLGIASQHHTTTYWQEDGKWMSQKKGGKPETNKNQDYLSSQLTKTDAKGTTEPIEVEGVPVPAPVEAPAPAAPAGRNKRGGRPLDLSTPIGPRTVTFSGTNTNQTKGTSNAAPPADGAFTTVSSVSRKLRKDGTFVPRTGRSANAPAQPVATPTNKAATSLVGWSTGNENLLKSLRVKKENSKLTRQEKRQFKSLKYGEKMNNLEKRHQSGEMISDRDFKKLGQWRDTQNMALGKPSAQAADDLAAAMKRASTPPAAPVSNPEMEDFTKKTPPTTPPKADDDDDDGISAGTPQNALDNLSIPDKVEEHFARWGKDFARKIPKKEVVKESISHEKKWKNYKRIVESTGGGHLSPNKFQQDMKSRRARNDVYTKPSGAKDTSKSDPFSTKAKSFGKSNTYFENMNEAEQEVLGSFELQSELNPAAFEGDVMIPEIRERLMEIAQDFLDGIDFKMDVEDITLTGSLANYNWSRYSDFDLHILVDYEAIDADQDLVKRFFQDIKAIWNIRHNIFLKGYEVEVYVQNTNEEHMSSGIYSVENDEWAIKPEREETVRSPVDKPNIEKKADDIIFQIDRAEKLFADGKLDDALDAVDRLKQKVRNLRKIGLSKDDGVYSVENLAFKTLRRSMELERLSTLKNKVYDRQMSIKQ